MNDDNTFRVWIGCLACYNNGGLVGQWYDASGAGEVTSTQIHKADRVAGRADGDTFYVRGDVNPHEELWCFDIENTPPGHRGEMSPMEAQRLADVIETLGDNAEAFALWCANTGTAFSEDSVSDFEDHFHGHHDSFRDYADELAEETLRSLDITSENGGRPGDREPHFAYRYFDWDSHANDLLHSDYFTEDAEDGGVYVFTS